MATDRHTKQDIRQVIRAELPELMKHDPEMRRFILMITRECHPDKWETENRFDRLLEELKQDREARDKKWAEQAKNWEAQAKNWEAQEKKWEAQEKKWEAQEKRWAENQRIINENIEAVKRLSQKHDSTIGALGARWGLHSESAFRDGLRSILEQSFGVRVERYLDYDHEGIVFGRPDQVELDVIIHDGTLILCEIKSSMSKSDLYAFWRKKNFYEDKHGRKATRSMVISPMIDQRARDVASQLNIELFGYAEDVQI